jgi:hypothetical protein
MGSEKKFRDYPFETKSNLVKQLSHPVAAAAAC